MHQGWFPSSQIMIIRLMKGKDIMVSMYQTLLKMIEMLVTSSDQEPSKQYIGYHIRTMLMYLPPGYYRPPG